MQIAEALRLLRTREGLTQTAASKREGAPDFRTLSHWETQRKMPSLKLLDGYLRSMGHDFHELQDALDLIEGKAPKPVRDGLKGLRDGLEGLGHRVDDLERRLQGIEAAGEEEPDPGEASDVAAGEASATGAREAEDAAAADGE